MRRAARGTIFAAVLAAPLWGCSTSFDVEGRDTPVHVWVEAPAASSAAFVTDLSIRVGEVVVVDGPVRFPAGTTRVAVPPVYVRSGERPVVVSAAGGRTLATATAEIEHATWVLVTVRGATASIRVFDREPGSLD